jgi:hypothetical protein
VWLTSPSLDERRWSEEDDVEERTIAEGTHDMQLGFAKLSDWHLVVRKATYRQEHNGQFTFLSAAAPTKLLEHSRETRIKALVLFPALAKAMKAQADAAVKAIADAKKFVA